MVKVPFLLFLRLTHYANLKQDFRFLNYFYPTLFIKMRFGTKKY